MKAVVFEEHGGTEVLQYTDIPEPEPRPFEVLIEVKAAGANFNDIWARRGMPGMKVIFPHVAGSDVSGVVRGGRLGGGGQGLRLLARPGRRRGGRAPRAVLPHL